MDKQKDFEKGWEEYKAKKKQEIEEIYRLIDNSCALVNNCIECQFGKQDKFDCDKLCAATAIINAGYRKIPKNAVVLTREEYGSLVTRPSLNTAIGVFEVRKKTAEKFAERLKETLGEFFDDNEDNDGKISKAICLIEIIGVVAKNGEVISLGLIDEIAKEITEGKK